VPAVAGLAVFLPPFLLPMALVAIFLSFDAFYDLAPWTDLAWVGCTVSMATGPCCLSLLQSRSVLRQQLSSQYVMRMHAYGATNRQIRRSILRNVMLELLPSFEKIISMILTILIFSEFVFSFPGIGIQTVRAITRADWGMLLDLVLLFSFFINVSRVASVFLHQHLDPQ
jgi:peptide/nickel transport system permease protein